MHAPERYVSSVLYYVAMTHTCGVTALLEYPSVELCNRLIK